MSELTRDFSSAPTPKHATVVYPTEGSRRLQEEEALVEDSEEGSM